MSGDRSPSGRFVEVDRATLYVEDHGVGPAVVLIHGGLSSSATWAPALPFLVDDFRVIAPDSRGHGRSTNESGTLSYAQLADDVAALIAAMGLVRPVVGGYSDGGQVALELGARHPQAASGLIVGAAYPDFVGPGLREVFRSMLGADEAGQPDLAHLDQVLGELAELVRSRHPGGQRQWQALVEQTAPMWLDYPGLTDGAIRAIEAPVLLYTGGSRRPDTARAHRAALPNAAERRTGRLPEHRPLRGDDAPTCPPRRRDHPRLRDPAHPLSLTPSPVCERRFAARETATGGDPGAPRHRVRRGEFCISRGLHVSNRQGRRFGVRLARRAAPRLGC